jgi:hypothetical protein
VFQGERRRPKSLRQLARRRTIPIHLLRWPAFR